MTQTTRYTKLVAEVTLGGTTYMAHGGMTAADGSPYLTTDIAEARDYSHGGSCPAGYRLLRRTRAVRRSCLGGGYILESGPTGP